MSTFSLKMIAVVTMMIDHIGYILFPHELIFRYIGRLAFPIYCFLIIEGFYHTRNLKKYELRLLLFALISEIPFDMATSGRVFDWNHQNVFFTLVIGLVLVEYLDKTQSSLKQILYMLLAVGLAALMKTDYTFIGVLMIMMFYRFKDNRKACIIMNALLQVGGYGMIQAPGLLAFIPIHFYNGKPGPKMGKYFFYAFYPVHLFILYLLRYQFGIFKYNLW